ncbi:rod shape-determining protein [Verrucomicrobia bacterium]|nr:rod shape-determining protein [Verrucomicrobiota bacterium]
MTDNIDEPEAEEANPPSDTSASADGKKRKMYVGLDLGTLLSCVVTKLTKPGSDDVPGELIPTVVGYPEDGILAGILPGNSSMLHGEEAMANQLHLRLVHPLSDGVVQDVDATKSFLNYLRDKIDPERKREVLCVVGIPAEADAEAKENLKKAATGAFDGVLFIPEPFLAALGMRDEEQVGNPDYQDPVSNSLFVDIGAGTTDFCIVQGYFPKPEDLMSIPFAGNEVDVILDQAIREAYPEVEVPLSMIRDFKESYSYVGESESGVRVKVPVEGKPRKIEVGKQVGGACNQLLEEVFETIKKVIAVASPESVFSLLQNIVLTGGGSRIRNIDQELQRLLLDDGYEDPEVRISAREVKPFVAIGAMKVAKAAREDQWVRL